MKRSTTNRRSNQSAMVETLETRRMFCFAPLDLPIYEVMDKNFVREHANCRMDRTEPRGPNGRRAFNPLGRRAELSADQGPRSGEPQTAHVLMSGNTP